jgi:hypothetical protein
MTNGNFKLLVLALFAGACVALAGCERKSAGQSVQDLKKYAKGLDDPFQVFLKKRDYELVGGEHDADMSSTWGVFQLRRVSGKTTDAAVMSETLRLARQQGWKQADEPVDVVNIRLATYGVGSIANSSMFTRSERLKGAQEPPTRYHCQVWVPSDASFMVVAFRVDAE